MGIFVSSSEALIGFFGNGFFEEKGTECLCRDSWRSRGNWKMCGDSTISIHVSIGQCIFNIYIFIHASVLFIGMQIDMHRCLLRLVCKS